MELLLTSQPDARSIPSLTAEHRQQLKDSAISEAMISERGYRSVASRAEWRMFDDTLPDRQIILPGIAFPVFRLGMTPPYAWVLRPDRPRLSQGTNPRPIKYEWPARVRPCLDVAPAQRALLADPTIPIWITEGAKKADALRSCYANRIVPLNLNGVWAWRGTSSAGGKLVLPDMDEVAWNGRIVVLAFDSDVIRKRQVLLALQRLAAVLTVRGVAEVRVLLLPQQGSDKCGVDDFLAGGNDAAALEAHLVPLAEATVAGRDKLFTHPHTGSDIYLPPGYLVNDATRAICRLDRHGQPTVIYPGFLAVTATGVDLASGDETLTVRWNGRGDQHGEVTAPRAELARGKGILDRMAALGAAVHDENARAIARYLVEFAHENSAALPRLAHLDRLGVVGEGVVLPAGSVGCIPPIIYRGRTTVRVGDDAAIYGETLRQAITWPEAWSFWAVFALTLASPLIARLRPRRNPALYLAGESGSGKTTIAQFAVGAYGDPTRAPLLVQAQRSTAAGFFQSLEHLGGLPLFVDEAHTAADPARLEGLAYQFANGETYTRGGLDGKTRGGEPLGGTLLLAGEALPVFRHAGAHRRMLWIDVTTWPPLGRDTLGRQGTAEHRLGQRRAALLERAWERGCGQFGKQVLEQIWADWPAFTALVAQAEHIATLAPLQAWRQPLAIAAATLTIAFQVANVTHDPHATAPQLVDRWADMLTGGQDESDPAVETWARLVTFIAQASISEPDGDLVWVEARDARSRALIACRHRADSFWRVLTDSDEFSERIGRTAVQLHGRSWARRGWVLPGKDGKSTTSMYIPNGVTTRVLRVPISALKTWAEVEDEER